MTLTIHSTIFHEPPRLKASLDRENILTTRHVLRVFSSMAEQVGRSLVRRIGRFKYNAHEHRRGAVHIETIEVLDNNLEAFVAMRDEALQVSSLVVGFQWQYKLLVLRIFAT
jgi:hypothetical protein